MKYQVGSHGHGLVYESSGDGPMLLARAPSDEKAIKIANALNALEGDISEDDLERAWLAWTEAWVTESGREAMRSALAAFVEGKK